MAWNKVPEINNPYTKKHPQKEPIKRWFDPADAPKPAKKRPKRDGKAWWDSLTKEQQSAYIAKKENERKGHTGPDMTGKKEKLPGGGMKIWDSNNQFSCYRYFMIDDNGDPIPSDQWDARKAQLDASGFKEV